MERSSLLFFCSTRNRQSGLTLIEVLVGLTVAATVGTLAVSAGRTFILNSNRTTQINILVADLALTKSEAIKRGTIVTICQSSTGKNCTGENRWHEGWIVFADPNRSHKIESGEHIIRVTRLETRGTIIYKGSVSHFIHYQPTGLGWPAGQFIFCDVRGLSAARFLIVNTVGRPRISATPADDDPVSCP